MKIRLEKITCPVCDAKINIDIQGKKTLFCPFCGNQFAIDNGETVITKNINITKKYTDDAALERERRKDRANEREHKEYKWTMIGLALLIVAFFVLPFGLLELMELKDEWDEKKKIDAGMIRAGQSASEMEGKSYLLIKEQLESAGFEHISLVDLDDAGIFINRSDTVESVTIGGDASFNSSDYFDPNAVVVISYH